MKKEVIVESNKEKTKNCLFKFVETCDSLSIFGFIIMAMGYISPCLARDNHSINGFKYIISTIGDGLVCLFLGFIIWGMFEFGCSIMLQKITRIRCEWFKRRKILFAITCLAFLFIFPINGSTELYKIISVLILCLVSQGSTYSSVESFEYGEKRSCQDSDVMISILRYSAVYKLFFLLGIILNIIGIAVNSNSFNWILALCRIALGLLINNPKVVVVVLLLIFFIVIMKTKKSKNDT